MIIGEGKTLKEILAMIENHSKIILAGCRGCVIVCSAGGEKEVGILSSAVSLARQSQGKEITIKEVTIERQCDPEYLEQIRSIVDEHEAILSIACGAGVQFLAETYRKTPIYPGINTNFIGVTQEQGVWTERCQSCGDCKLHLTGGICPITRCAKSLFNGPCGGSSKGKCEVNPETGEIDEGGYRPDLDAALDALEYQREKIALHLGAKVKEYENLPPNASQQSSISLKLYLSQNTWIYVNSHG